MTPAKLAAEIRADPAARHAGARPAAQQAKSDAKDTESFLNFLQDFLLAFGGIALFVGAFVIANSLSITIAQRTREFATLRTLGASRRQVRRSIVVEALVIGTLASVVGIFVGLGLGVGLFKLFDAVGFTLPNNGLVLQTRTVSSRCSSGSSSPCSRACAPRSARRACRRSRPCARARRCRRGASRKYRPVGSALLTVAGFAAARSTACSAAASGRQQILLWMGLGTLLIFIGVALLSARFVRPLAWALGAPASRFGGAAGSLARDNSRRNPQRTASTASALMIGLALVTLVAVLAAGITKSFRGAVDDLWISGYAITAQNNFEPIPIAAGNAAAQHAGRRGDRQRARRRRAHLRDGAPGHGGRTRAARRSSTSSGWTVGSNAVIAHLGAHGAFVDDDFAKTHHLKVGSPVTLTAPTGETRPISHVTGIFKPPTGGSPFGPVTISERPFDQHLRRSRRTSTSFVDDARRRHDARTGGARAAAEAVPEREGADRRSSSSDNQISGLNAILNVLYVLLALSVIVSLFGIVNTLVLTVFERTREIGMLRAVGMTRRQVRRMIRARERRSRR